MRLTEREVAVRNISLAEPLIKTLHGQMQSSLSINEKPIRFVVTESDKETWHCEIGVLTGYDKVPGRPSSSIFDFAHRGCENTDAFNAVLIVPTGIGCEIGGHAGDAGPVARLLAGACDTLITHPNVVNASDINELPGNGLYVEGSVLTRMLMGTAGLQKVRSNRVLLVIDEHEDYRISELVVNSVSAARATLGLECNQVVRLNPPISMSADYSSSGTAVGRVDGLERLYEVLDSCRGEYDAVALASVIGVPEDYHERYFDSHGEMVNPWGGIEAMLTHALSMIYEVPTAHAPMMENIEILNKTFGLVDPRMSAEAISNCFIHSVLKGLHRSPRIVTDPTHFSSPGVLSAADVSCIVIPDGCVGLPTLAAIEQNIPVIAVRENRNCMRNDLQALPFPPGKLFVVDNYLEAVGVMTALKAGVALPSVRRPLAPTCVTTRISDKQSSDVIPNSTRPI